MQLKRKSMPSSLFRCAILHSSPKVWVIHLRERAFVMALCGAAALAGRPAILHVGGRHGRRLGTGAQRRSGTWERVNY